MSIGTHPSPLGRSHPPRSWAVGLAAAGLGLQVFSYALVGIVHAVGGDDAISDNAVGATGALAFLGGLAVLAVSFVLAVYARARHDRRSNLWLPLAAFPAALAVVVLLELLVVE